MMDDAYLMSSILNLSGYPVIRAETSNGSCIEAQIISARNHAISYRGWTKWRAVWLKLVLCVGIHTNGHTSQFGCGYKPVFDNIKHEGLEHVIKRGPVSGLLLLPIQCHSQP
jgi:hypothetical protein